MAKKYVRVLSNAIPGSKVVETEEGMARTRSRVRSYEPGRQAHQRADCRTDSLGVSTQRRAKRALRAHNNDVSTRRMSKDVWNSLDCDDKSSICKQVWGFVEELKTIPKPLHLQHLYQCTADGKLAHDTFVKKNDRESNEKESDILSETALRKRICDNYYDRYGRQYTKVQLFDKLPCTGKPSVFTHGELRPKNIMVSGSQVTAILDWETAGWYPEYWEQIDLLYACGDWKDWKDFMLACAPQTWNLEGLRAARRVLF